VCVCVWLYIVIFYADTIESCIRQCMVFGRWNLQVVGRDRVISIVSWLV